MSLARTMSRQTSFGIVVIVCIAGLSFAAGRMPRSTSPVITSPPAEQLAADGPADLRAETVEVPPRVPNVVAMPFDDTYVLLKAAGPETIRSYYGELAKLSPKPTRRAALATFFKTLVHIDPVLTRELILALKGDDRWTALFAIREAAPPRAMHAAAEVLLNYDRSLISGCSWDQLGDTLEEWSKNDPLAVKQFLETHQAHNVERYYPKLVRNWAAYDPEAARQWITEITAKHPPPPKDDENLGDGSTATAAGMLSSWLEGFLENDAEAAMQYILENPTNEIVSEALRPIAGNLFTMSPDRARDFIRQLPEEQRATSLSGIAEQANRFVRSNAVDPTTSPRFIAEWMRRAVPGQWEGQIGHVLMEWKYGNAPELLAWMAELPTAEREAAVRRFPTFVFEDKPREDFDLIMQADDLVLRDRLLEKLAQGTTFHGEALLRVIQTSELPPAQKLHLGSLIPHPPEYSAAASDSSAE